MQWKRLAYYLLINIVVSAITTLIVLNLWERRQQTAIENATPVVVLPTPAPTEPPVSPTPSLTPTPNYRVHEVASGETLGQITTAYDLTIADLLGANELEDPNELEIGQEIYIPYPAEEQDQEEAATQQPTEESEPETDSDAQAAIEVGAQIEIVSIVGVGDIATERVELGDLKGEKHALQGWYLEDEDGHTFTFPQATLYEDGEIWINTRAGTNTPINLYWGLEEAIWEPGEFATLYDPEGNAQATYQVP